MRKNIIKSSIILAGLALQIHANPFACYGGAEVFMREMDPGLMSKIIDERVNAKDAIAMDDCTTAELMRRNGDVRAEKFYLKALEKDPNEAGFYLFYANYLTQNRGSWVPLTEKGEKYYYIGLDKIRAKEAAQEGKLSKPDATVKDWLLRGLVKIYQNDGMPLYLSKGYPYKQSSDWNINKPGIFLTLKSQYTHGFTDFEQPGSIRYLTGEAMKIQRDQQAPSLPDQYYKDILRLKDIYEQYARLRIRHSIGVLDFYYKQINMSNAMITSYQLFNMSDNPVVVANKMDKFNDLEIKEAGATVSRSFDLYPVFDLYTELNSSLIHRKGMIEYIPDQADSVIQLMARGRLSRFVGPDKFNLEGVAIYHEIQDTKYPANHSFYSIIDPLPITPRDASDTTLSTGELRGQKALIYNGETLKRDRTMLGGRFDYAIYRPIWLPFIGKTYTRGWHWYVGYFEDQERWMGETWRSQDIITMTDTYAGTALKGIWGSDLRIQYTLFNYDTWNEYPVKDRQYVYSIKQDSIKQPFEHSQHRIYVNFMKRIIDEDVTPGMPVSRGGFMPAFWQIQFPVTAEWARTGLNIYENYKVGVFSDAKFILPWANGASIITTAGYYQQKFTKLNKTVNLYEGSINLGWNFMPW